MDRANDTPDVELTTLTLTRWERVVIARALIMSVTLVEALGDPDRDATIRDLLDLHQRVCPEDVTAP